MFGRSTIRSPTDNNSYLFRDNETDINEEDLLSDDSDLEHDDLYEDAPSPPSSNESNG